QNLLNDIESTELADSSTNHDSSSLIRLTKQILESFQNPKQRTLFLEAQIDGSFMLRSRQQRHLKAPICPEMPAKVPAQWRNGLTARLKILANLDIAERRIPQNGLIQCQTTE